MARVRILYFASVREAIGTDEETHDLPDGLTTPRAIAGWLAARGAGHAAAFADMTRLRAACDRKMTGLDEAIGDVGEIAFFPPVTGG